MNGEPASGRIYKCRRQVGTGRCTFEGDNEAAGQHWREAGHGRCICCSSFLRDDETQTCLRCVGKVRADLADIVTAYALLPDVIEHSGFTGRIPVDPLTLYADGSVESPVQQAHPELYRDVEWPTDPTPVIAELESWERMWRGEFGHGPAVMVATVSSCASYLTQWLGHASRNFLAFDDFAVAMRGLRSDLQHRTGVADDPMHGVSCFDCGDDLIRTYRPPSVDTQRRIAAALRPVIAQRIAEASYGIAQPTAPYPAAKRSGQDRDGLEDLWHCRGCDRVYEPSEYYLAVRAKLEAEACA